MGTVCSCLTCGMCCAADSADNKSRKKKKSRKNKNLDECDVIRSCCCCFTICCSCCSADQSGDKDTGYVSRVLDPRLNGYDSYGNLRCGLPEHDRNHELSEVMALDSTNREESEVWNIMDSCWVNEWLCFVHTDQNVSPSPGPCYNQRLIRQDDEGNWVPKGNLVLEGTGRIGDYRKVSKQTWDLFVMLYPGSGPPITAQFAVAEKKTEVDLEAEKLQEEQDKKDEERGLHKADRENRAKDKEIIDPYKINGLYPTDSWTIGEVKQFKAKKGSIFAGMMNLKGKADKARNAVSGVKIDEDGNKDADAESTVESLLKAPVGGSNNRASVAAANKFAAIKTAQSSGLTTTSTGNAANDRMSMELAPMRSGLPIPPSNPGAAGGASKQGPPKAVPKKGKNADFFHDLYEKNDSDDEDSDDSEGGGDKLLASTSPSEAGL